MGGLKKVDFPYMGVEPKIGGFLPPQIMRLNRVFPYFHHPFWGVGVPLFLETPL